MMKGGSGGGDGDAATSPAPGAASHTGTIAIAVAKSVKLDQQYIQSWSGPTGGGVSQRSSMAWSGEPSAVVALAQLLNCAPRCHTIQHSEVGAWAEACEVTAKSIATRSMMRDIFMTFLPAHFGCRIDPPYQDASLT